MKKNVSKILALALAVIMAASVLSVTAFAADNTPIVYVHGDNTIYKTTEDGQRVGLFDDGEYVEQFKDGLVPLLAKAVVTGDWTEYSDHALSVFLPAVEGFAPNPDGTLPEGSGIDWSWSESTLRPTMWFGSEPVYEFYTDSRLSPLVIADQINEFVQAVKRRTGFDKIHLLGRCEGTAFVSAYLYKYGPETNYADIDMLFYINGTMNGVGYADALMSGNVTIPATAGYNFIHHLDSYTGLFNEMDLSGSEEILSLLTDTIEMLHETYGLEITVDLIEKIYTGLKDVFFAKLLKAYWGVSLGFVSCVNEHFEDYVNYIFQEEGDKELYANIISQARDYHENVQVRLPEILQNAKNSDVNVIVVAEYGTQQYPISEDCELIGDYMISVERQSFGATTSKVTETLPESYIQAQTDKGLGDYISADKQIDASTCLFPDNTWFIKNLIHDFPAQMNALLGEIGRDRNSDIHTTHYGQFLNYQESLSVFEPLQAENVNDMQWESEEPGVGTRNMLQRFLDFFKKFIEWIQVFVAGIVSHSAA